MKYPMFDAFDQPDTNFTCERRTVTTVPTQALTMLNNEFFLMQAKLFAERAKKEAGDSAAAQVTQVYRIAYSRPPTPNELDRDLSFLKKQKDLREAASQSSKAEASGVDIDVLTDLADVILNSSEFIFIK